MADFLEFIAFFAFAAATLYIGYQGDGLKKLLWNLLSLLFWLATGYQWMFDHAGTTEVLLVIVFVAPLFLTVFNIYEAAWSLAPTGKQGYK